MIRISAASNASRQRRVRPVQIGFVAEPDQEVASNLGKPLAMGRRELALPAGFFALAERMRLRRRNAGGHCGCVAADILRLAHVPSVELRHLFDNYRLPIGDQILKPDRETVAVREPTLVTVKPCRDIWEVNTGHCGL